MAARIPDVVNRGGATPTVISPAAGGDTFPAGGNTYVRFTTTGTAITVSVTPPASGGPLGTTVSPVPIVLPATGVREYGPFPQYPFGDQNGNVNLSYAPSVTGLSIEIKTYAG
jgi:hypothetical protein